MPITRNGRMLASLKLGTSQIAFVYRGTTQVWMHEVVVVLGPSGAATYLADLFTPTVWSSTTPKRVVVPAGVERGSSGSWVFAVFNGTQANSFGGSLTLENRGTLSARGGTVNSGVGGDVVNANVLGRAGQKLVINNYGTLRAGGGGGGKAGNGGAGSYNYTYTEGPHYSGTSYVWRMYHADSGDQNQDSILYLYWGGSLVHQQAGLRSSIEALTSVSTGGWTYGRSSAVHPGNTYYISRQQTRSASSTGGIAGNGGRGQGYDGAATSGAAAVAGGTNAGASGKSGNGGAWGAAGQAGATGSAGNVGSGLAGSTGGLAGFAVASIANAILNNYGTLLGR